MPVQEFTALEQRFVEASGRPEITVRRRRMVIIVAIVLIAAIIVAALLPVSRTYFVLGFAAYVLITLWEKVAYANGVLVYKSVIRKLLAPPTTKPQLTSFAPQFLVDDLARSIVYYQRLGFAFGEPWDGFYAIGRLNGLELHLKEAPKHEHEHLDAAGGVDGIEAFYAQCAANGVRIVKPLAATAWGTMDFYVEDPDGNVVSFGGRPAAG